MPTIKKSRLIRGVLGRPFRNAGAPVNGTNEVQTLTFGGTWIAAETFKLVFRGYTTAAITWSATNATLVANIDAALESLPSIGTGGVTTAVASMTNGIGTITVTFTGNNAKLVVPLLSVTANTSASGTLVPTETTAGVSATGRGQAGVGASLVDTTNGVQHVNLGTALEPVWSPTSAGSRTVEAHTASDTLLANESGSIHTNTGAAGAITLTLPAATVGLSFIFGVGVAQELRLDPNGSETISLPSSGVPGAAGKYLVADAIGETVHLQCVKAGNWAVMGYTGTWTAEA